LCNAPDRLTGIDFAKGLMLNIGIRSCGIMIVEIVPGIHRVNGVRGANCYLAVTGNTLLIIDTGLAENAKRILGYIERLRRSPEG